MALYDITDKIITLGGPSTPEFLSGEAKIPKIGFDELPVEVRTSETSLADLITEADIEPGTAHPDTVVYPNMYVDEIINAGLVPGFGYRANVVYRGDLGTSKRHRTVSSTKRTIQIPHPTDPEVTFLLGMVFTTLVDSYLTTTEPSSAEINTKVTPPNAPPTTGIFDPDDFNGAKYNVNVPPYIIFTDPPSPNVGFWILEDRKSTPLGPSGGAVWSAQDSFAYLAEITPA